MMTTLITGGTGGIGSALVRAFSDFSDVIFLYHSNDEKAKLLADTYRCKAIKCDVSNSEAVKQSANDILKSYGHVDNIINNAGISQIKLFGDITDADWRRMIDVHLTGTFNVSKAFLPTMLNRKRGSIINISSVWGVYGASCEVHYSAAKAGMIGMTKALAKEVAPSNIRVNAIAPGVIDTSMNGDLSPDEMAELVEDIPLKRLGTPEDVANAAIFLCKSEYITGEVLGVDGGFC